MRSKAGHRQLVICWLAVEMTMGHTVWYGSSRHLQKTGVHQMYIAWHDEQVLATAGSHKHRADTHWHVTKLPNPLTSSQGHKNVMI